MLTYGLITLDWMLLRLRYPFIGKYDWTPDWLLRIRLVPLSWPSWSGDLRERYEYPQYQ